ncbi:MAG TPA: DUF427 domain-containing protein [Miltoncostaeaceae bacterium]|nr:DUF427 domain-containing protein [Miltoncostaeaceae bacterium]
MRVVLGGETIADTTRAVRVLETSHPPAFYLPRADVVPGALVTAHGSSFCEWKGQAAYLDVVGGGGVAPRAAWWYPDPVAAFAALRGHVAFYPGRMDACLVDDELVRSQEGDFYGGWITDEIVGPFKGAPGTWGW